MDIWKLYKEAIRGFYRTELSSAGIPLPPINEKEAEWLIAQQATNAAIKYAAPCYVQLLCFATNVGFTVAQLNESGWSIIDNARATIEKAESQWYQGYWNLVGPYFTVSNYSGDKKSWLSIAHHAV